MIVGIRTLHCFLAITILSGCGAMWIPIDSPEPERPSYDMLDKLIGQSREAVVEKLGIPREFTLDDRQFMLYMGSATSTSTEIIWAFAIPMPTGDKSYHTKISCLMIDLGSDNLVKQYKFKSLKSGRYENMSTECLRRFFSQKELNMMFPDVPALKGDEMGHLLGLIGILIVLAL